MSDGDPVEHLEIPGGGRSICSAAKAYGIGNKAGLVNLGKTQMTSSCPEPTRRRIATSIAGLRRGRH